LPSPVAGATEEERGGGRVASLIVTDIHNIPNYEGGISIEKKDRSAQMEFSSVAGLNNVVI
jgi:hypothetical protein